MNYEQFYVLSNVHMIHFAHAQTVFIYFFNKLGTIEQFRQITQSCSDIRSNLWFTNTHKHTQILILQSFSFKFRCKFSFSFSRDTLRKMIRYSSRWICNMVNILENLSDSRCFCEFLLEMDSNCCVLTSTWRERGGEMEREREKWISPSFRLMWILYFWLKFIHLTYLTSIHLKRINFEAN